MKKIFCQIITIGDEILFGHILDSNAQWLSFELDKIGIITKKDIIINSEPILTVDDLRDCNKTWLKEYMAS